MKLARLIILSFSSSALLILSFPPLSCHFLIWLSLVPLFIAVGGVSPKNAFRLSFFSGLVAYGVLARWLYNLFGLPCISLFAILAFFIAIFGLLFNYSLKQKDPLLLLISVPSLWVAIEFFRSECWPLKFTWFSLGYSQVPVLPILQFAAVLGIYGISFLILLLNTFFYLAFTRRLRGKKLAGAGSFILGLLLAVYLAGLFSIPPLEEGKIKVAAVQSEASEFSSYANLTRLALSYQPRLVLWPEYALLEYPLSDKGALAQLEDLAREGNFYLVFGATRYYEEDPRNFYNSAVVISAEGEIVGIYDKIVPVQFMKDGVAGRKFPVFSTSLGKLGTPICYDLDYPYISRALVRKGAEILVVPNYDAVHWGELQHIQHSEMTPMRAVENRRWIVRAASSGISQIVDPYGRVVGELGGMEEGILLGKASLVKKRSFYSLIGWLFPYLCVLVALVGVVKTTKTTFSP